MTSSGCQESFDEDPVLADRLFHLSFEQAAIGMALVGLDGRWLKVNSRLCEILRRTEAEVLATDVQSITPEEDMVSDQAQADRLLRGEATRYELQKRYFLPDGSTIRVLLNVSLVRNSDGQPSHFFSQIQDITQQVETREKLAESQRLFEELSKNSRTVLWRIDGDGLYTYISELSREVHGYAPEELVGKVRYYELCPDAERAALLQAANAIIKEGRAFRDLENCVTTKQGDLIWLSTSGIPIFDAAGELIGYEGWDVDITETRALRQRIQRTQRLESIGLLASGLAHNLNNALTPVLLSVNLLKSTNLPEDARALVGTMEDGVRRSADVVGQILSFAGGSEGSRRLEDLRPVLESVTKMVHETFPDNISVRTTIDPDLHPVVVNRGQIHQVLMNLCLNARDALPEGGRIALSAGNEALAVEQAHDHPGIEPGSYVVLGVEDTGTGMDQATLSKLFVPFFTTKEPGKGTGLGLATAEGIIKAHGGFIEVASEPRRGSRFSIWLPALSDAVDPP